MSEKKMVLRQHLFTKEGWDFPLREICKFAEQFNRDDLSVYVNEYHEVYLAYSELETDEEYERRLRYEAIDKKYRLERDRYQYEELKRKFESK